MLLGCVGKNLDFDGDVSTSQMQFTGDADPSIIEKSIRNHLGQIKWCYERELNAFPTLEGKVTTIFTFDRSGLVQEAGIKESTVNNEEMQNCIVKTIVSIKFPSGSKDKIQVIYPFLFKLR